MKEKQLAFRVGVVVVAAAVLAIMLIGRFGSGKGAFTSRYTIFLRFPQAPGVTVDTPVRKNGIHIGRVTDVALERDHVVLTAMIDSGREIMKSEVCTIRTTSLLGDPVLEFVQGSDKPPTNEIVSHGDFLSDGVVATDPLQVLTNLEGEMRSAMTAIKTAATDFSVLSRTFNETIGSNDQQILRLLNKLEAGLDSFQRTTMTIDDVFGDPELKQGLKRALTDLPRMFAQAEQALGQAQAAMKRLDRVGAKAEQNLDNLAGFTGPLGEKGDRLMTDLVRSVENFEEISSQVLVFSQSINSSDGTLGKLINDRDTYDRFQAMLKSFEDASRQLQPILDNAKIATDKIATDPRILGARGALDRKPSGVGRKWSDAGIPFNTQSR